MLDTSIVKQRVCLDFQHESFRETITQLGLILTVSQPAGYRGEYKRAR